MALTSDERAKVFLILGIPVQAPQEFDKDLSQKEIVDNAGGFPEFTYDYSTEAIDALNTMMDNISTTHSNIVRSIISEWNSIKYETVKVKTNKIELNYDVKRGRLRQLLLTILPIYVGGVNTHNSQLSIG